MKHQLFARRRTLRDMHGTRPPAVAGLFYPGDAGPLHRAVERFLDAAATAELPATLPKAVIAPHAGYPYSGPIAGSAFEPWRALVGQIERVVLLGPSHRVAFDGLALPEADVFETPLGRVEVDLEAAAQLAELPQVIVDALPHAQEHSLEVELPFLQEVLGPFRLVPLVVGRASALEVAEVLARVWDGDSTRIVISSDLSHYLPWATARRVDAETAEAIVAVRGELRPEQACGALPINGLLRLAQERGLRAELRDLRNSGDTAGDRTQVVGYGAFLFEESGGDADESVVAHA